MLYDLIGKDWQQYVYSDQRLQDTINRERAALAEYAESDKANPRYIAKMNSIFQTVANYMQATENVLEAIMSAREIVGGSYQGQRSEYQSRELKEENQKLKLYLQSMGKDPELVRYMKVKDFSY